MSKVQHCTPARLTWALWAAHLLLQTAVFVIAFLARSYSNPAETLPLFTGVLLFFPLNPDIAITNPLGLEGASGLLQFCATLGTYMLVLGMLGTVLSLIVRLWRAHGIERQQLKLFSYALVVYAAAEGAFAFVPSQQPPLPIVIVDAFAAAFVAVAAGIAILRYRLWDIDIIIRRTLVYGVLTLTLGLVYVGCIVMGRTLIAPYIGGSELTIVASTLAIAALFNPLRRRIQSLIDRRFYRRKYDAAKVLQAFGATARRDRSRAAQRRNAEGGRRDHAAGVRGVVAA